MSTTEVLAVPVPVPASVLVVGGSLVGLSAAMFLAARGVPTILVERHRASSPHPRAIGFTPRTLELFRTVGLDRQIPVTPPGFRLRRARIESLAGTWHEESEWTPPQKGQKEPPAAVAPPADSPSTGAAIAQDSLEPMLREKAIALGADLRLGTELVSFVQDADGVDVTLRERDGGREYVVRASYVIAADGNKSPVREALRIARRGRGLIRTLRSVLFRAPLEAYLAKGISQFEIRQPGLEAFLTTYGDGRWVLMFHDDEERDEATLHAKIRQAIGREDLPVEILTTGRWELTALIAERFAEGRIFLAGDAAHTLPPTRGGFGANTGIHDAYDLAWKLAAVLGGESTPALLESYDAERRPVAWSRLEQTFARPDYAEHAGGIADGVTIRPDVAMELGQLYRSRVILGAGPELPEARTPPEWAGQPGTRAPHVVVVTQDRAAVSTLDRFGRGWVLLAEDGAWAEAARQASEALGIAVEVVHVGRDVVFPDDTPFTRAFGVGHEGASLVRPDGYVAWRATEAPADRAAALTSALGAAASATRAAMV